MEKQLLLINTFLGTSFGTMPEALLHVETLKSSNLEKYKQVQLLLQDDEPEDETDKPEDKPEDEPNEQDKELVTLPQPVKVNPTKWAKSLKSSNQRKGFPTLTGIAKELEGLEGFPLFDVTDCEVRVTDSNTVDTKNESYLGICFIYDGKLVRCKVPVSKLSSVEQEVLEGLPFKFSTCEYVETVIDNNEVNYIKYSFAPLS